MQRPLFVLGAVALFATRSVPAQQTAVDPHCQSLTSGDACQKALDLYKYLNNQLGTLIVGGNAHCDEALALFGQRYQQFPRPALQVEQMGRAIVGHEAFERGQQLGGKPPGAGIA